MHAGLFAGLAWLWMHALPSTPRRRALRVALAGLLFAVLTEVGQGLLPLGRSPSLMDALADAAGMAGGIALFHAGLRLRPPSSTQTPPRPRPD